MKKTITLFLLLLSFIEVKAQEITTDYIYSADGFEVKTAVYSDERNTYRSTGLYTRDGKTFVAAMHSTRDYITTNTFIILDGCETISSGAFQSVYNQQIYIPSSVKSIAPDAFTSKVRVNGASNSMNLYNVFRGIVDNATEEDDNTDALKAPPAIEDSSGESARYNLQGQKLAYPTPGINILQHPDGTTQKLLN